MKKIISLLFVLAICMAPAQAQILKSLGEKAIQVATKGAKDAAGNQVFKRLENKATKAVNDAFDKALGEVKEDTISAAVGENASALGKALGEATAAYAGAISSLATGAQNVTLRDFSEQNAARREHNKTLTYDNWD